MFKLKAPEPDICSISFEDVQYDLTKDGFFEVPAQAVGVFVPLGFELFDEAKPAAPAPYIAPVEDAPNTLMQDYIAGHSTSDGVVIAKEEIKDTSIEEDSLVKILADEKSRIEMAEMQKIPEPKSVDAKTIQTKK
jgi:hypothetical protein